MYATDVRQTDVRQTSDKSIAYCLRPIGAEASPPYGGGGITITIEFIQRHTIVTSEALECCVDTVWR